MSHNDKISTEPYKGVRDFYPEENAIQKYIKSGMRSAVESFGYVEYDASILEPAELYRAKSGDEIVNEQTYSFVDRGDREVTLRPEMTPTVARMVAARQHELAFPLRWYSIPNLFRYEKPQRGRLREHWQLNVDLFGPQGVEADAEIITVAASVLKKLGATRSDFTIKINSRILMNDLYTRFSLDETQSKKVTRLIDKKDKIPAEVFLTSLEEIMGDSSSAMELAELISSPDTFLETMSETQSVKDIVALIQQLDTMGFDNVAFTPTIARGFDYYTGMVFEIFDTDPQNPRAIAGGGRYDELLDVFGSRTIPTAGFGMGDVVLADFLSVRNLLPTYRSETDLYIAVFDDTCMPAAQTLAKMLRAEGINVAIDLSGKKIGDQIKIADKQHIPYIVVIGEDEVNTAMYTLKELESGTEKKLGAAGIASEILETKTKTEEIEK